MKLQSIYLERCERNHMSRGYAHVLLVKMWIDDLMRRWVVVIRKNSRIFPNYLRTNLKVNKDNYGKELLKYKRS